MHKLGQDGCLHLRPDIFMTPPLFNDARGFLFSGYLCNRACVHDHIREVC